MSEPSNRRHFMVSRASVVAALGSGTSNFYRFVNDAGAVSTTGKTITVPTVGSTVYA